MSEEGTGGLFVFYGDMRIFRNKEENLKVDEKEIF
jgi:hypothetical protein